MERLQNTLTIACGVLLFGAVTAGSVVPEQDGKLLGVSVVTLWQATNVINTEFLTNEPTFVKQGNGYVGTASLNAMKPGTSDRIGVDITWTVGVIDGKAAALRAAFAVPADAQYVISAHYDYTRAKTTVDTYSVVSVRDGNLVAQHLGFKQADGTNVPEQMELARSVFKTLGINGPFMNRIVFED